MKKKDAATNISLILSLSGNILNVFGSYYLKNVVWSIILGIITCLLIIYFLYLRFDKLGIVIGITLSIISFYQMYNELGKATNDAFIGEISKSDIVGDLYIEIDKIYLEYVNDESQNYIAEKVSIRKGDVEKFVLTSLDHDISINEFEIDDNKLMISKIPVGNYDCLIKLKDCSIYNGNFKLQETDLNNSAWMKSIAVQLNVDYKTFNIEIYNSIHELLKNAQCDIEVDGIKNIKNVTSDSNGQLPYNFVAPSNQKLIITLHYEGKEYKKNINVDEIENTLKIIFNTPHNESKISVTEQHKPDDSANHVYVNEWDVNNDIGIDGRKYGGGLKVTFSNFFIETGSSLPQDITSRIMFPVNGDDVDPYFEGILILDQTMYGSESTGIIKIIINGKEVYSTGKISNNSVEPFEFKVNYRDADTIVIETNVKLSRSSFTFGIVSKK